MKKKHVITLIIVVAAICFFSALWLDTAIAPIIPESYNRVWFYEARCGSHRIELSEEQAEELISICKDYKAIYVGGDSLKNEKECQLYQQRGSDSAQQPLRFLPALCGSVSRGHL